MNTGRPEALPENYYLTNFHALASFVMDTYPDILSAQEHNWYQCLLASPEAAQRLYIRLVSRKSSVFRLSRLKYSEIENVREAAQALAEGGLISIDPPAQLETLVREFTKPELARICELSAAVSRVAMVSCLVDSAEQQKLSHTHQLQQADSWITVLGHQYWTVFNLCFFGNLYQDSSEFVLRDLGALRYEDYQIEPQARPFSSRRHIDAHLRYYECSVLLDTVDSKNASHLLDLVQLLPKGIEGDRHLARRLDRFRNRVARQLERLNYKDEALSLYCLSTHSPARERRVRILTAQEKFNEALALCKEMLSTPQGDSEAQIAQRLQRKLEKNIGLLVKSSKRFRPDTTRLTLHASSGRVEHAAQQFYSRIGKSYYVENALVNGVLGLLIWDVIFHPVPGAFFNPFQSAPTDFHTTSFIELREDLLASKMTLINDSLRFSACIMDGYECHHGKSNPLVWWDYLSPELLSLALQHIPAEHWTAMFERILSDLRENSTGFPDLILFPETGGYEFIEIKGPGDTLQHNQRRWMKYFSDHRIPCRVVHVRWAQSTGQTAN